MRQVFLRDLRLSIRAGGGFGLALVFFLIVIFLIPLGIGPDGNLLARVSPGVLWVTALLSCLLSLDRVFATDWEDGSLELLVSSPIPPEGIVAAKAAAHWCTTGLPLCVAGPALSFIVNMPPSGLAWLGLSMLAGTPALSVIGTFGAALTLGIKRGGMLLSLLVLPMYIPTLILGAEATRRGILDQSPQIPFLLMLAVTLLAVGLLPFAGGTVLRLSLR
ncbi:MAG: heme exporter protein CcmB [Rhodobacteraceae bacterium]|nr:heme exporter protein CcmB [Paracoccaceae bacterium]